MYIFIYDIYRRREIIFCHLQDKDHIIFEMIRNGNLRMQNL